MRQYIQKLALLATTFVFVIAPLFMKADNLNRLLRQLKQGMHESEVITIAGTPKEIIPVERWFYAQENQVVVADNKIIDIRLSPEMKDRRISFRNHHDHETMNPVRLLRIGMPAEKRLKLPVNR